MISNIKKFALLRLTPAWPINGFTSCTSNQVIADVEAVSDVDAIQHFQREYPLIPLDEKGYGKNGSETFTVAEYFNPFS